MTSPTPVQAATLQLLVPGAGGSNCDFIGSSPAIPSICVVVASAATDEVGHYPLPATPHLSQAFSHIPLKLPAGVDHYDLEISAAGFNTTVQEVVNKKGLNCPTSGAKNNVCSFGLEHGFLRGSTSLRHPNSSPNNLDLLVMAEDSGTDNIENLTTSIIPIGASRGSFTMLVPDASPSLAGTIPVTDFDVFAVVQDLFGSSPQKASGHLIEAAAKVGAPDSCKTLAIGKLPDTDCVGLGSVVGTVNGANPATTSIRMSKKLASGDTVQFMETEPNSIGVPPSANAYNFCAPFDSYTLTHYESDDAISSADVTLAAPVPVPTPCKSICGGTADTCLQCRPVTAPAL